MSAWEKNSNGSLWCSCTGAKLIRFCLEKLGSGKMITVCREKKSKSTKHPNYSGFGLRCMFRLDGICFRI